MRTLPVLIVVLATAIALAQGTVHYRITLEGGAQGEARLTQTKRPEGGKTVRLVATLHRGNTALEITTESTFDAVGAPIRKVQGYGPAGKAAQHQTIVTFDAAGANVVVREHGVPKASNVPLAAKLSRANAAETWFVLAKPKPGDVAKAWTFDPDALEWVPTETTYVGPVKGGHKLHIVRRERMSDAVVDDNGIPVLLEDGAMKLERS